MQDPEGTPPTLKRVLSPIGVILLAFSALSPAFSVYIGGDAVLQLAGTGAAVAFLLGGIAAAALGLLYAEVGAAFPGAGGVYPSLAALLGPRWAFPYIVLLAPTAFAQTAFAALGMADYVQVLIPGVSILPLAFAGMVAATIIAVLNIRFGALVTGIFLAIEAIALTILTSVALLHPARSLASVIAHPVMLDHGLLTSVPLFTLGLATVSGMWACGGASWGMYFAEEMHDARRKIGRVVAWTGFIASLTIAGPVIAMLTSAADVTSVLAAPAPMAAFLRATGGPVISLVVSAGVAAAIFNSLVACMIAYSRYLYATGRDRIWPGVVSKVLASLHPTLHSPLTATVILAVLSALMCLLGNKALLILISGNVADYVLISAAILVGRRSGRTGEYFKAPLHPMIPVFGLAVTVMAVVSDLLDADAGRPSVILLASLFVAAYAYYHFRLRQVSKGWSINTVGVEAMGAVDIEALGAAD
jgi:amino acid transporter